MKVSIFSPKFRVSVAGDTKEGAKCRREKFPQISVKISGKSLQLQAKNQRNLQKIAGSCNKIHELTSCLIPFHNGKGVISLSSKKENISYYSFTFIEIEFFIIH